MSKYYAILRFEKRHKGSIAKIGNHHERAKDSYKSNPDIDKERSHLNYHLKKPTGTYTQMVTERITQAKCRTRKDSVLLVDTFIGATNEFLTELSPDGKKEYFKHAYDFIANQIGEHNIMSAAIHMDEKTPHMHLVFTPFTPDNRLSAKEVLGNPKRFEKWQEDFYNHMHGRYDCLERGKPAKETGRKHIRGRSITGAGAVVNITNGTFTMQPGSRIFGHNTSSTTGATVTITGASAGFVMNGGRIENNLNTEAIGTTTANGGVTLTNGTFTMNGGIIRNNRRGATAGDQDSGVLADVYVNTTTAITAQDTLRLSGNGGIGVLTLSAASATVRPRVGISAPFTGGIDTLNLRSSDNNIGPTVFWWPIDTQIFNGMNPHTITASDMANIGLGSFISQNNTQRLLSDIASPRTIDNNGVLMPIGGRGTPEDPFQISTEEELRQMARGAAPRTSWTVSAHYILMNDIELTSGNWTAIGGVFAGSFNGNGFTINDLTINLPTDVNQGMFGNISANGIVENFGLLDVDIIGGNWTGAVAGRNSGTVRNVFATGSVRGNTDVGGIVGLLSAGGTISNVLSLASVTGNITGIGSGLGGITGAANGTLLNNVALNPSITNTGNSASANTSVGRVRGVNGTPTNNFGRDPHTVTVTAGVFTLDTATKDGANVTSTQWSNAAWWARAATPAPAGPAFSLTNPNPSIYTGWIWAKHPPHLLATTHAIPASFLLDTAEITVTATHGGEVSLMGGFMFFPAPWEQTHVEEMLTGFEVTVFAQALDGYVFIGWMDDEGEIVSTDPEFTFTAEEDITLYALFEPLAGMNGFLFLPDNDCICACTCDPDCGNGPDCPNFIPCGCDYGLPPEEDEYDLDKKEEDEDDADDPDENEEEEDPKDDETDDDPTDQNDPTDPDGDIDMKEEEPEPEIDSDPDGEDTDPDFNDDDFYEPLNQDDLDALENDMDELNDLIVGYGN